MNTDRLQQLLTAVERSVGQRIDSPRDFEMLSDSLAARVGEGLSVSTLKRIWGYVNNDFMPTRHTLDVLARFLGYDGWDGFVSERPDGSAPSDPIMADRLSVVGDAVAVGERVRLVWAPDRECVAVYRGDLRWEVESAENTRLRPGDTFSCGLIIAGEPLYLDDLRQPGRRPTAYVCGQIAGVRFELLDRPKPEP